MMLENEQKTATHEISAVVLVEIGAFLKRAENLMNQNTGWEPQRQLTKLWQGRLIKMQQETTHLSVIEEPTLIVAIMGGVKAGKTHLANMILGQPVLAESQRHETRRAWVVYPPGIAEIEVSELLGSIKPEWLQWVRYGTQIGGRKLILIDLPDFDAESQLAGFQENQQIVENVLNAADVIVLVSSQAHNLTRRTFQWLQQFRQGHGFIFVYNEVSGAEGTEAMARIQQLREQVSLAGFSKKITILNSPYKPNQYVFPEINQALNELPANRVLRTWRIAEQIRLLTGDIRTVYQSLEPDLIRMQENIQKYITHPIQQQFQEEIQLKVEAMQSAIQRELLFRVGRGIGGPFGAFLAIRRLFHYWSLPGVWLGSRLMGTPGALIATGSMLIGSLVRSFEVWRDRRKLKNKDLESEIEIQTRQIDTERININLELEQVQLDSLLIPSSSQKQQGRREFTQQLTQTMESAFDEEFGLNQKLKRKNFVQKLQSWFARFWWNLLPALILIYTFVIILLSVANQFPFFPDNWQLLKRPVEISFYINILALFLVLCYIEYLILTALLKRANQRLKRKILNNLLAIENPFLIQLAARIEAPARFVQQALLLEKEVDKLQKKLRQQLKGVEISQN
ncbi:GTPase domain-containing protein [candidate division KSB1 bacterium]|nr:GTPase domain-containing protein [candidate division KSB1 bacterium]